jgi:hypothetical protein
VNGIVIYQGKSEEMILQLMKSDGTIYEPDGVITKVVFGVKSGEFGGLLIDKELDYDSEQQGYLLQLDPEDTEDIPEGGYSYDFSYYTADGFYNAVPTGKFIVLRGVTKYEEE